MTADNILTDTKATDIAATITALQRWHGARVELINRPVEGAPIPVLLHPAGLEIAELKPILDEYLATPERIEQTVHLADLESFIAYVRAYSDLDTALFADAGDVLDDRRPRLTAIIDQHRKGPDPKPRWGRHRAVFSFPLAQEWRAWAKATAAGRKPMSQTEFAEFMQERLLDVMALDEVPPALAAMAQSLELYPLATQSQLLNFSKGLSVRVDMAVTNEIDVSSGQSRLLFKNEHKDEAGGVLRVPGAFVISVPIFEGGALQPVFVRLRYRIVEKSTVWSLLLHRPEIVLRDAFRAEVELARKALNLSTYYASAPDAAG